MKRVIIKREKSPDERVENLSKALVKEIAEHNIALAELKNSRKRTETLMSNLPGMVFQCLNNPPEFTFTFVSGGAHKLTGYTPEQLMSAGAHKLFEMIHPDDADNGIIFNREAMAASLAPEASFRIVMQDGTVKWIRGKLYVAERNVDGAPHLFEGYYTDITVQKQLETAALANKAKSDFLANMSHEIRTPMNAVFGMTELALRRELSPEVREYLQNIRAASSSLLAIINDILDFSKIESGAAGLLIAEYDTVSFINDIVTMAYVRINGKPVTLIVEDDPALPAKMSGDITKVKQIATNLLTNAIKFTDMGHIIFKVGAKTGADGNNKMTLSVTDTGIGIKQEDIPNLYQNFSQMDTKRNRSIEGTGLGLPITKRLVELMGGEISVSSEYGKGSTFYCEFNQEPCGGAGGGTVRITAPEQKKAALCLESAALTEAVAAKLSYFGIPYAVTKEIAGTEGFTHVFFDACNAGKVCGAKNSRLILLKKNYAESDSAVKGAANINMALTTHILAGIFNAGKNEDAGQSVSTAASGVGNGQLKLKNTRVLVVDDIEVNLLIAENILAEYGAEVHIASSGAEAVSLVRTGSYDIVFMDHMMPGMDGVEATSLIRSSAEDKCRKVPIIALTANAVSGMREMFLQSGMNDFLSKPLEFSELQAMLIKWLPPEKTSV